MDLNSFDKHSRRNWDTARSKTYGLNCQGDDYAQYTILDRTPNEKKVKTKSPIVYACLTPPPSIVTINVQIAYADYLEDSCV